MSGADRFIDTNVLVCLLSADDRRAEIAERLVASGGVISVQVLNEFANVALRKHALDFAEIGESLAMFRALLDVRPLTVETHELGLALARRHGFSPYDAMIVAAARQAGCSTLLSEDMHTGRVVDGTLRLVDPFA